MSSRKSSGAGLRPSAPQNAAQGFSGASAGIATTERHSAATPVGTPVSVGFDPKVPSPSLLSSLQKRAAQLRSMLGNCPEAADVVATAQPEPVKETQSPAANSRESSGGSAGGRIWLRDVRVSASQLAAALASASSTLTAVRERGTSVHSSGVKDTAMSTDDAGASAGAAARQSDTGLSTPAGGSDAVSSDEASRRAKLAGGASVGRLPASVYAPFMPEQPVDGSGVRAESAAPAEVFSAEGQAFVAPRLLPQDQELLPARFVPHPPAQPPAPLHAERQPGLAAAPVQPPAVLAAATALHHPAIQATTIAEYAEQPAHTADGNGASESVPSTLTVGTPNSHHSPPLDVPAVRVPARATIVDQHGDRQPPGALARGPHERQQQRQQVAATTSLESWSVAALPAVPLPLSTGRGAAAPAPTHQEAADAAADTLGSGKLADPPAAADVGGGGGDETAAPRNNTSTGGGINDDDYNVRARGLEAALCEDVLAAAIASARASAQAAFFSPGAPRALPRQPGHSGRASSSGTPASPGAGGGAHNRQPHPVGGVSAAAAPYLAYSPGAMTPGTGTAASSVRSGYSPVRSPYDLLLHGGLTSTGPAAVLLPMGPGSDGGRSAGGAAAVATAARTAWSTASTAGGSSAGGGGGDSRGRGAVGHSRDTMGAEFFRRNNLLQRKRQQWAAQGQREREGGSGLSTEVRLSAPGTSAASVSRSQLPSNGDVKMGAVQPPLRSLADLQRWAERRDQRLAVLREEREEAERAAQESHSFRPQITEKSRRMVEAARARSPDARLRRPWAVSPVPGPAATVLGHDGGDAEDAVDDTPAAMAQPEAHLNPRQHPAPQQLQPAPQLLPTQQQVEPAIVAVPAPAGDDLLNALRGSRPWHTPPQAAAATAAAASLRSSVAAAAAAELLNGHSLAPTHGVYGANGGGVKTPTVSAATAVSVGAKTPGKGAASKTPGRAGGSVTAGGGCGTPSAATLLTAARHSKSRGRYSLAADSEAVVGAVSEAIEDAAAALRRNVDGSTSPRRSANGLAPRLRTDAAARDTSGASSTGAVAPGPVTKRLQEESSTAARHAPGHVGGTLVPDPAMPLGYPSASGLDHQLQPHESSSYAAMYGAHHEVSASAGLHYASQSPTFGAQPGVIASTYYPVPLEASARGLGSSGGGGTTPALVMAPAPYTVVPDPRQPFPGYGTISNNVSNAAAFGATVAGEGASRPVSNGSWAAELSTCSRGGSAATATSGSAAAAAPARSSLPASSASRRNTRSLSGAGGAAVVSITARRTSSSGGTGGGSGGGAPPGACSPVQRPQAPVPPHSPSPSPSPTPVFMSPVSAVRGSNHNSSRMSRARVSWSDLVSGGSGGGAAGADSGPRRSTGGMDEAAGLASITQPAAGSAMDTASPLRESLGGAPPQGAVEAPSASAVLEARMEQPVATSSFVLPLAWQHPSDEVSTPRAALPRTVAGEQQQQQQQQESREAASEVPPQMAPTSDTLAYSARSREAGFATSAVTAALAVPSSCTADSPDVCTNGPAMRDAGEPTGGAGAVAASLGTAAGASIAGRHAAWGSVPVARGDGASDQSCSNEPSGGGAASEPSFAAMHTAARSNAEASSSGGGEASRATRGWSLGAGTVNVLEAASFALDRQGNHGEQAPPRATPPPPRRPVPEEQNDAAAQQRQHELEGQKDSLTAALEAALMAAAAAAAAAAASAEKGRKLAGREAPSAAAAHVSALAPLQARELHGEGSGSGRLSLPEGTPVTAISPAGGSSAVDDVTTGVAGAAVGQASQATSSPIDGGAPSAAPTRDMPQSSINSSDGIDGAPVPPTADSDQSRAAVSDTVMPAPVVSQKALATAAAIALRARSDTSLQAVSPGAAAATSAALGLSAAQGGADRNGEELAVSDRVGSHSGPILTMRDSGPAGVPAGVTSTSAGGLPPAAPSPQRESASVASGPRDARGVAFARLPGSNPSSATSTPRKLSASLSMSAAHSLAAMAAVAAAGGNLSAGGAPPASPAMGQHSATLRAYASVGGAPDLYPRPASPLRPVGSARKNGLTLPPGVDGIALTSTPPASPPNGIIRTSIATAAAAAQGFGPSGASSSRRRSSLLSAGGSVDRALVKAAVTSPEEQANGDIAEVGNTSADRSAGSPAAALALADLIPQLEREDQQRQGPELPEQQAQLAGRTQAQHDESDHGGSLSALLRQIEVLRSGSAAAASTPKPGTAAAALTISAAGPATVATASLSGPVHGTTSRAGADAAGAAGTNAAPGAQPSRAGSASVATDATPNRRQPGNMDKNSSELSLDALVRRAELARAAALMAATGTGEV